jgi:hypothetical protein
MHSKAAVAGPDAVPDGPAAITGAEWLVGGVTRTEGGSELNPPLVTLTENTATSGHGIQRNAVGSIGPTVRTRAYVRAGTRRYIVIAPSTASSAVMMTIDTQTWTVTEAAVQAAAYLLSVAITDLGNGDRLVEVISRHGSAEADWSAFHGAPAATGGTAWTLSYLGDGISTILIRRIDVETTTVSPVLGSGTPTKVSATGVSLTGATQHTPAGRSCVIRYVCQTTVTQAYNALTATFQGKAVVFPSGSQAHPSGVIGRCFVGVGYVTGLTPGLAGSLVITSNRNLAQLVARVDDVANLSPYIVGAAVANSYNGAAISSHSAGVASQAAGSLWLGVGGAGSGAVDPLNVGGTWTEQSEDQTGTSATADVAASFATKTGGTLGATETMAVNSAAATTAANWAVAAVEFKS